MKKILSVLLALCLTLSLGVTALASNGTKDVQITYRGIRIVVNGQLVNPVDANGKSTEPFIIDGTTYLPVRAVAGALGLEVGWDNATSTVSLRSGGEVSNAGGTPASSSETKTVNITYRDIKIVIDGVQIQPADANGKAVEPFILDGTTYLPIRAVAGALGAEVSWDGATSTVELTTAVYLPSKVTTTTSMQYGAWSYSSASVTVNTYDEAGNLLSVVTTGDDGNSRSDYTYDPEGRVLSIVNSGDLGNSVQTYAYDEYGNPVAESYSDDDTESAGTYTYNEAGLPLTHEYTSTDKADGRVYSESGSYTYDGQGLLIKEFITVNDGGSVSTQTIVHTYDGQGRPLKDTISHSEGYVFTSTYTYDGVGNMLTETCSGSDGYSYASTYTYDGAGNMLTETYSDSDGYSYTGTYTYNGAGDPLTETFSDSDGYSYTSTCTYNGAGDLLTESFSDSDGDSYSWTYIYDAPDHVTSVEYVLNGNKTVTTVEYGEGGMPVRVVTEGSGMNIVVEIEYIKF